MARPKETIAALATPAGTSALAIVRISGSDTIRLASATLRVAPPTRAATHCDYRDFSGAVVDDVVATLFRGPHSYTGEDTLELACHGSPYIAQRILSDLVARGCRQAAPGEFTQRAFLNGRMDLSQAEAVMDLINARSERALAAAQQVLRGALGRHMAKLVDGLIGALATVEAYIDFPDEDLPPEDRGTLSAAISGVLLGARQLLATQKTGALLRDGIVTVIVGEPNAGKSSLLNRIVGTDRAIVSPEPGTTRDFIEERITIGANGLRLVDTAGLNPAATGIEALGIEKTLERLGASDLHLVVLDASRPTPAFPAAFWDRITSDNTLVVLNKWDIARDGSGAVPPDGFPVARVSALSGEGMDALLVSLSLLADGLQKTYGDERIAINVRHAHFLGEAQACLESALAKVSEKGPVELLASDLRGALAALGEISGKVDNERMLDQLFASFCIGK
ncbi:MAG TPA: tRNA uridine-5-carboxymethylaminomethyl(34) synthesis GTPase MnmE [Opitutaceae bacterium]|jgi:tRNA modification GTPase|nr:tRNA uridine-5-carboxymethylaminomethyl(34) synthesis GTPase MnmE [Opitutaceae bacterium]